MLHYDPSFSFNIKAVEVQRELETCSISIQLISSNGVLKKFFLSLFSELLGGSAG